jgi:hypothetical protein
MITFKFVIKKGKIMMKRLSFGEPQGEIRGS